MLLMVWKGLMVEFKVLSALGCLEFRDRMDNGGLNLLNANLNENIFNPPSPLPNPPNLDFSDHDEDEVKVKLENEDGVSSPETFVSWTSTPPRAELIDPIQLVDQEQISETPDVRLGMLGGSAAIMDIETNDLFGGTQ